MKNTSKSSIHSKDVYNRTSNNTCVWCYDTITTNNREDVHSSNSKNKIDLSGYKGKVSFEGCGHEYHTTCFISRYNITKESRCYCITKTKSNIPTTNSEDINNAKDIMILQNVEKTSMLSSETLQLLKRNVEEFQRDKLVINTTIGTNVIDNLAAKTVDILTVNEYPDWTKMPNRVSILTYIKTIRTLDDIEKMKKHCFVNFNVLFKKGVTILDLVQSFGDKLQRAFIDALLYLEIDNTDKLLKLRFSLTFLRKDLHHIFDPDRMREVYKIDYIFINSLKSSPYDLCNMKYRADLLKDMGFNVETLVEFGITGDHVEQMGLDVLEWKTSLGLNEKNYNMLNITPKNIQNMKWDPDTVKNTFKLGSSSVDMNESSEFIISKYPTADALINSVISKEDSIVGSIESLSIDSKLKSKKKNRR